MTPWTEAHTRLWAELQAVRQPRIYQEIALADAAGRRVTVIGELTEAEAERARRACQRARLAGVVRLGVCWAEWRAAAAALRRMQG